MTFLHVNAPLNKMFFFNTYLLQLAGSRWAESPTDYVQKLSLEKNDSFIDF
jgi:hypothetical protein